MYNRFRLPFLFHKKGSSLFVAAFFVVEIEWLVFEQSENSDAVRHISISRHQSYKPVAAKYKGVVILQNNCKIKRPV